MPNQSASRWEALRQMLEIPLMAEIEGMSADESIDLILDYAIHYETLSVGLLETANKLGSTDHEDELIRRMREPKHRKEAHERIFRLSEILGGMIDDDYRSRYTMKGGEA